MRRLVHQAEWRRRRQELEAAGGYQILPRRLRGRKSSAATSARWGEGMILEGAEVQRIAQNHGVPRDSH